MLRQIPIIVAILCASCKQSPGPVGAQPEPADSGTEEPRPASTSGQRLRRVMVKGSDGSEQHVGWFDQELKEDCSFIRASDGRLRCLPQGRSFAGTYGDPDCTAPLLSIPSGCAPGAYALRVVDEAGSCGGQAHQEVRPVGREVFGDPFYWTGTICEQRESPGLVHFALGDALDPEMFVRGKREVE